VFHFDRVAGGLCEMQKKITRLVDAELSVLCISAPWFQVRDLRS